MLTKIRSWYGKYERPISSLSLIGGFVFDALTLKRVDLFWENLWVIGHIVIVGACIVLIHAIEREEGAEANPSKLHFWLTNIQQFFYGGIWSTFLVFYFRSGDLAVSWPFLLILVLSFWANESLKRHFVRLAFQISLFFLSVFCFAIFLVPVLLHKIGRGPFLLSGAASLIFIILFLFVIRLTNVEEFKKSRKILALCIAGVFALMNVFYFTGVIPPLPLAIKDAGAFYSVRRNSQGNYVVTGQQQNWRDEFRLYPDFSIVKGSPVFVYTAVFSPPDFDLSISHEWQRLDSATNKWVTISQIPLKVIGGRDGGFRTYSEKTSGLLPGHWRVNVLTSGGQLVGRVRFNLVLMAGPVETVEQVK